MTRNRSVKLIRHFCFKLSFYLPEAKYAKNIAILIPAAQHYSCQLRCSCFNQQESNNIIVSQHVYSRINASTEETLQLHQVAVSQTVSIAGVQFVVGFPRVAFLCHRFGDKLWSDNCVNFFTQSVFLLREWLPNDWVYYLEVALLNRAPFCHQILWLLCKWRVLQ